MNFSKALTTFNLLFSLTFFAQTPAPASEKDKLSLSDGNLNEQFDYVITKSSFWDKDGEPYRVIKLSWLTDLKAHVLDTLIVAKKEAAATGSTIKAQNQEIKDLKARISKTQNNIDKYSIKQISKNGYTGYMWAVIGLLLAFLIFFIYKFKNSNAVTIEAKRALTNVEEEYEEYRKTAVEREQKVRRQLQDEINKQKAVNPKK